MVGVHGGSGPDMKCNQWKSSDIILWCDEKDPSQKRKKETDHSTACNCQEKKEVDKYLKH